MKIVWNSLRGSVRAVSLVAALSCCSVFAGIAHAQNVVYEFDPARTTVTFTLGDVLHTVHGSFKLKSGNIHFDPSTGAAGGTIVVDAGSGDSGNSGRDRRMHKDILESQKYPEITFTATRVSGRIGEPRPSHLEIQGTMNLHGSDHDLTIGADIEPASEQLSAETHFPLPYVKWGLKNPSTLILRVSPSVDIEIHAVGRLSGLLPSH